MSIWEARRPLFPRGPFAGRVDAGCLLGAGTGRQESYTEFLRREVPMPAIMDSYPVDDGLIMIG
jgi:hypothetical protein